MQATENTVSILKQCDCWAVAAIRCEWVQITEKGTRSQSMALRAQVLAATDERVVSPLEIKQYVADEAILSPQQPYLVALMCDVDYDGSFTWKVIQREALKEADPDGAVTAAQESLLRALGTGMSLRVSLAWASLSDEALPAAGPGFTPAVRLPPHDCRVTLRFGEQSIPAILRAPAAAVPPAALSERVIFATQRIDNPAGSAFHMHYNGEFAAVGTVLAEE